MKLLRRNEPFIPQQSLCVPTVFKNTWTYLGIRVGTSPKKGRRIHRMPTQTDRLLRSSRMPSGIAEPIFRRMNELYFRSVSVPLGRNTVQTDSLNALCAVVLG